jgi:hypothetical protein
VQSPAVVCYKISIPSLTPKEMLMHTRRRPRIPPLFDLFTPPPTQPTWDSLPAAVREKVVAMLARMLHDHRVPKPVLADRKEAEDE